MHGPDRGSLLSGDAVILARASMGRRPAPRAEVHRGGRIATVDTWHVWAVDRTASIPR